MAKPAARAAAKPAARRWLFPAAVLLLLPTALITAHSSRFPVESYQIFSWYMTYECGYISRGLVGSAVKLFHGESPAMEDITRIIFVLSSLLLVAVVGAAWALFAWPLLTVKRQRQTRWLLAAAALLLLTSPLWKLASYMKGHMDLWVFSCALVALFALLRRRPLLFAAALIIGTMVHRLMLPYAVLLTLLLLHALFIRRDFIPAGTDDRQERQRWGIAAAGAFAVMLLLQFLSDPKNDACALLASNYADRENMASQFDIIRSTTSMFLHNLSKWVIFPATFWSGMVYFGLPPLLCAVFFAFCCRHRRLDFACRPSLPRPLQLARDGGALLLPLAGAAITLPLHLVVADWSRVYYWSWFGLTLVAIYYCWHTTDPAPPAPAASGKKNRPPPRPRDSASPVTIAAAAAFTLTALTYSATPLLWANIVYPQLVRFPCDRLCFFPLTQNPLGTWWGNKMYYDLAASAMPFHATGSQLQRMEVPGMHDFSTDGDAIIIPPGYEDRPLILEFTMPAASAFRYRVDYEAAEAQPFHLTINKGTVEPTATAPGRMEWAFPISRDKSRRIILRLYPRSRSDITLKNVSFEMIPPP